MQAPSNADDIFYCLRLSEDENLLLCFGIILLHLQIYL